MDPGWRFALGDVAGADASEFNDTAWRVLDLPHDGSVEGTLDGNAPGVGPIGYLPTGIGWYRRTFRLPTALRGREALLEFDGVYMNSDVWINGQHLGKRPYGYVSFAYDITRHLRPGTNVIAVRVDNSKQPNSRWYSGSGIYRHVWLTLEQPLHLAHWGMFVTPRTADTASATVEVRTRVENHFADSRRATLRSVVIDASAREVARVDTTISLRAGEQIEVRQQLRVSSP